MQGTETVSNTGCCQIVSIVEFGSRKHRKQGRKGRLDEKFNSLDKMSQKGIISYAIGYLMAANDLIERNRKARTDEMSRMFEVVENKINEAHNGGMV